VLYRSCSIIPVRSYGQSEQPVPSFMLLLKSKRPASLMGRNTYLSNLMISSDVADLWISAMKESAVRDFLVLQFYCGGVACCKMCR